MHKDNVKDIKSPIRTKRAGYLYERICDPDNIKAAIWKASEKKRNQKYVRQILKKIDHYAEIIQKLLKDQSYIPSKYTFKTINDGIRQKKREIAKPRFFPDQCIHHALMQVLEESIMKGMYYYNCGSVPGRGDKRIRKAVTKLIRKRPEKARYVAKMDVHHFYQSIDHDELKRILRKKIKDKKALWLCDVIIDSCESGIPIGNYTSQWFCNLFLEDLDHKIKAFLGKDYGYYRYVDDMVIIGPNKRKLHKCRKMIQEELQKKKLEMKQDWQVFRMKSRATQTKWNAFCASKTKETWQAYKKSCRALDFLGCKFYPDGHVELRKSILKRVKRKARKIQRLGKHINARNASAMMAYMGRLHCTNSEMLYRMEIKPYIGGTRRLRKEISHERKLQRKTAGDLVGGTKRSAGRVCNHSFL